MTSHWLLDTSALLALRDKEEGADWVASLLQGLSSAVGGRCLDRRRRSAASPRSG